MLGEGREKKESDKDEDVGWRKAVDVEERAKISALRKQRRQSLSPGKPVWLIVVHRQSRCVCLCSRVVYVGEDTVLHRNSRWSSHFLAPHLCKDPKGKSTIFLSAHICLWGLCKRCRATQCKETDHCQGEEGKSQRRKCLKRSEKWLNKYWMLTTVVWGRLCGSRSLQIMIMWYCNCIHVKSQTYFENKQEYRIQLAKHITRNNCAMNRINC